MFSQIPAKTQVLADQLATGSRWQMRIFLRDLRLLRIRWGSQVSREAGSVLIWIRSGRPSNSILGTPCRQQGLLDGENGNPFCVLLDPLKTKRNFCASRQQMNVDYFWENRNEGIFMRLVSRLNQSWRERNVRDSQTGANTGQLLLLGVLPAIRSYDDPPPLLL